MSITKCPSGVMMNMQAVKSSTGPAACGMKACTAACRGSRSASRCCRSRLSGSHASETLNLPILSPAGRRRKQTGRQAGRQMGRRANERTGGREGRQTGRQTGRQACLKMPVHFRAAHRALVLPRKSGGWVLCTGCCHMCCLNIMPRSFRHEQLAWNCSGPACGSWTERTRFAAKRREAIKGRPTM